MQTASLPSEIFVSPPGARVINIDGLSKPRGDASLLSSESSESGKKKAMVEQVISEIKQALLQQGHDVGDALDDPDHWKDIIGDTGELAAAMDISPGCPDGDFVVTKPSFERLYTGSPIGSVLVKSDVSIRSDITDDFANMKLKPRGKKKTSSRKKNSDRSNRKKTALDGFNSPSSQLLSPESQVKTPSSGSSRRRQYQLAIDTAEHPELLFPGAENFLDDPCYDSGTLRRGSSGLVSDGVLDASEETKDTKVESSPKKDVRFNNIEIRPYERIIGDHPSCSNGPPIAIGWGFGNAKNYSVEEFESCRGRRRSSDELMLERHAREQILRNLGYTAKDLATATRNIRMVQHQRKRTLNNLDKTTFQFEVAMESAIRKAKRAFGVGGIAAKDIRAQ